MDDEEKQKLILDQWTKEGLAKNWVKEHLKYNNAREQNEELQARIDKAIEYLKLFDDNSTLIDHSIIKGALNILQGSDKE